VPCSVQEQFPPHICLYCCSVHTFLYLLRIIVLPFTTMHFSFSASVTWWFLLSPLHNLLVVVPKVFLAPAEICCPPDGGQWSDNDIHLSFMVRFHDRSEENRSQPYRNHNQSERWMGPRKKKTKVDGYMEWPIYHKVQCFNFCRIICLKTATSHSHM